MQFTTGESGRVAEAGGAHALGPAHAEGAGWDTNNRCEVVLLEQLRARLHPEERRDDQKVSIPGV